jgi:acyl transferase domain-containing protein
MGTATGVFVGQMYEEYAARTAMSEPVDGYTLTGSTGAVVSGRLSYMLGVQGPCLTVDTASSSSLVALHLACQSLAQGECSAALAGAVNLMLTPDPFVAFSRLRGLSPEGRCNSFDAAADGVVWSEGCGMLVLKRLVDAERDGDRVLGVIRATAINQDGRSNGLTAPSGPAQQAVIRQALDRAGLSPTAVQYVECHGSGTTLGDPIEVIALAAALGEGRESGDPVLVGSVKSVVGHAQAAAGMAGVIKTVLSLQHSLLPPVLHYRTPNPRIPWSELAVRVVSEPTPWPRDGSPRIAGVNSFGIAGTNAHVVLEEAPDAVGDAGATNEPVTRVPLLVSARQRRRASCAGGTLVGVAAGASGGAVVRRGEHGGAASHAL